MTDDDDSRKKKGVNWEKLFNARLGLYVCVLGVIYGSHGEFSFCVWLWDLRFGQKNDS